MVVSLYRFNETFRLVSFNNQTFHIFSYIFYRLSQTVIVYLYPYNLIKLVL